MRREERLLLTNKLAVVFYHSSPGKQAVLYRWLVMSQRQ